MAKRRAKEVRGWAMGLAIGVLALPACADGQGSDLHVQLEHETSAEARMQEELEAMLVAYDLDPWIMTREVVIDERSIPHSHPVLTIHTRHLGDEMHLLTTFVHEQLHWLEDARPDEWRAAMADFQEAFPQVPPTDQGGARDDESTYRHLLVCDMELQAMEALVGEDRAREVLAEITHYEWIYERVLGDDRVREIALAHGFDVSTGVPQALRAAR